MSFERHARCFGLPECHAKGTALRFNPRIFDLGVFLRDASWTLARRGLLEVCGPLVHDVYIWFPVRLFLFVLSVCSVVTTGPFWQRRHVLLRSKGPEANYYRPPIGEPAHGIRFPDITRSSCCFGKFLRHQSDSSSNPGLSFSRLVAPHRLFDPSTPIVSQPLGGRQQLGPAQFSTFAKLDFVVRQRPALCVKVSLPDSNGVGAARRVGTRHADIR